MNNTISVITRTSNRPIYFDRCYNSVLQQPHVENHHVIYDDPKDLAYLSGKRIIKHHDPAPETATPPKLCLHNLYFNNIYDKIQTSWVYHLDDDNYLVNGAFLNLHTYLSSDIDVIILRIYHNGAALPSDDNFNNRNIQLAGIDTGCILVRTELAKQVVWDGWKCADYRFITNCVKISKNPIWINQIVMRQDDINNGNRQDLQKKL
jgi:hypothetical protein